MTSKSSNDLSLKMLERDYLRIIRWMGLAICTLISLAFSIAGAAVLLTLPWYFVVLVFVTLVGLMFGVLNAYLTHWYRKYSYRLEDERLAINRGVFWRHQMAIPISRVQHVDVNSGPLDRRYNLAKLVVNTAGTHYAQTSLPGLSVEQAHELRDRLLVMQEGDSV